MDKIIIGDFNLYQIAMYFFAYAFLGWVCEVIFATLKTGKFINRGFLNGPVCPIYGFGVILVLLVLTPLKDNLLIQFLGSIILTSLIELITGFILERFFHRKWWDYSKEPLNIGGYVCARFSLLWGFACLLVLKVFHPIINKILMFPNIILGYIFLVISLLLVFTDLFLTILQIRKYSARVEKLFTLTSEMRKASDALGESISTKTLQAKDEYEKLSLRIKNSRLVKAFPHLHESITKEQTKKKGE